MKTPRSQVARSCSWLVVVATMLLNCGCHTAWIASNGSAIVHRLASSEPHEQWRAKLASNSEVHPAAMALPDLLKFAQSKGLKVGKAYRRVDSIPGPVSWIVVAADPTQLILHRWNFPLVGLVPYKGYRFQENAEAEADHLNRTGWEAEVLPVPAWSSLGWFPEPVPRSLLDLPEYRWATILLHELVHRTVHIPSQSDLNEGLATFLADQFTHEWLVSRHGDDADQVKLHRMRYRDEMRLNRILGGYRERLLKGNRDRSERQFLLELEQESWELFSPEQLTRQKWGLARVLLAEVYNPEAVDWQAIWRQTGQELPNLIFQIKEGKVGTRQPAASSSPLEGTSDR